MYTFFCRRGPSGGKKPGKSRLCGAFSLQAGEKPAILSELKMGWKTHPVAEGAFLPAQERDDPSRPLRGPAVLIRSVRDESKTLPAHGAQLEALLRGAGALCPAGHPLPALAGGGGAGGNGSAQAKGGSGGGGNGAYSGTNAQPSSGAANTGGGGGGMYYNLTNVGKGGSGIVVIRNHR